ncbi:MAG: hypothetical protein PHO10_08140 [Gemmiger sp.]|nr:hypothetical protein [Gemmiger sp.]
MEQEINIEQVMDEIRAAAAAAPEYQGGDAFAPGTPGGLQKLHIALRRVGRKVKAVFQKLAGKFVRVFVAMYLFAKNQLKDGKNVILDTATKTNDLTGYVHGEVERRLVALEEENAALRAELDALQNEKRAG